MKAYNSKAWNAQTLAHLSSNLSGGYAPGLNADFPVGDRWTAHRHAQVSRMIGHGYNPGV